MVYLIEDDLSVTRSFHILLDSHEIDHESFITAEEYLQATKPGNGDVIILDINLPGMKGTELLKSLYESGLNIPVIVVTAHDDDIIRDTCIRYGVRAYMRKPVSGTALIDLVKYHLYIQYQK